jgi:hypothetical protein
MGYLLMIFDKFELNSSKSVQNSAITALYCAVGKNEKFRKAGEEELNVKKIKEHFAEFEAMVSPDCANFAKQLIFMEPKKDNAIIYWRVNNQNLDNPKYIQAAAIPRLSVDDFENRFQAHGNNEVAQGDMEMSMRIERNQKDLSILDQTLRSRILEESRIDAARDKNNLSKFAPDKYLIKPNDVTTEAKEERQIHTKPSNINYQPVNQNPLLSQAQPSSSSMLITTRVDQPINQSRKPDSNLNPFLNSAQVMSSSTANVDNQKLITFANERPIGEAPRQDTETSSSNVQNIRSQVPYPPYDRRSYIKDQANMSFPQPPSNPQPTSSQNTGSNVHSNPMAFDLSSPSVLPQTSTTTQYNNLPPPQDNTTSNLSPPTFTPPQQNTSLQQPPPLQPQPLLQPLPQPTPRDPLSNHPSFHSPHLPPPPYNFMEYDRDSLADNLLLSTPRESIGNTVFSTQ